MLFVWYFSTRIEKATVVTKGIPSLIEFRKIRGDALLQDHLERENEQEEVGRVLVHHRCIFIQFSSSIVSKDI